MEKPFRRYQIPYSLLMFWGLSNLIINSSSNPIQGPKTKLCSSLREPCSYCESSTILNTQFNPFPGIPKLNEYISTISHEYFSEIVDNFIEKQNEIMKSQLNELRFNFSLLPGPVNQLFNKKPEGISRINKEIGNFVHCIRKRSQKDLRGCKLIKNIL
uniref:Uncharacterized protein n=1 Tax=Theileria parva TaxID=5875 RepID=Q4N4I7_THEPA|eukprot:XP_765219.1 hypothetical protein [Theileria parva strain Muguga]